MWRSLRKRKNPTLSLKFSAFAWKALHNAVKVGEYWRGKGPCEERMACTQCNAETESLQHIMFECRVSGQHTVWKLARKAWEKTGLPWPHLTVDLIIGIGLSDIQTDGGKSLRGRTRLYQILVSESAYLIWLLRCEWRIGREQNTLELHTENEITARWKKTMETRLRIDWALTSRLAYGKKAQRKELVAETWHNVAKDRKSLRPDLVGAGGLVGRTSSRRPPGRNR